jgi:hypothetical protein
MRPRGGYIGFNRVPAAAAINSAASGVWTLREADALKRAGTWPRSFGATLLLRMDGADNSTIFTDSSDTPLTVTAVGNAKISTTQSKFGGSSGFFDGSGDYLTISDSAMNVGSGNFTIEGWVYPTSIPAGFATMWAHRTNLNAYGGALLVSNNAALELYIANSSATDWDIVGHSTGLTLTTNSWQHLALVRDGNTLRTFRDGVAGNTISVSGTIGVSGNFSIMAGSGSGGQEVAGYLDDFRFAKEAFYTAAFTPGQY